MSQKNKDFNSISPSARSLLLMKGYTDISYAKQAAALMQGPEVFDLSFDQHDFWFWIKVMHFESRYKSIDQLMQAEEICNILELSSGFSLRGLDLCSRRSDIHYIDTDLPETIALKQEMIAQLEPGAPKGRLELLPLNAVDSSSFKEIINRFSDQPLMIINEGLLMYLDTAEKEQLCRNIHQALKKNGGSWITADVYVKRSAEQRAMVPQSKSEAEFMEQHNIEANKFENYEDALRFFERNGFEMVEEAKPDFGNISVLLQVLGTMPEEMRNATAPPPKIQATWKLRAV